jgi:hypothetical protein
MRRFIKTFTVKKFTQFTVVQDGERRAFFVLRWDAGGRGPQDVGEPFPYENERASVDDARGRAIGFARKLAAEAEQSRALGEPAAALTPAEEAAQDARAAARAQGLSPSAQAAAAASRRR